MKSQALLPMGQRQTYSVPLFHVSQQLGKHLFTCCMSDIEKSIGAGGRKETVVECWSH